MAAIARNMFEIIVNAQSMLSRIAAWLLVTSTAGLAADFAPLPSPGTGIHDWPQQGRTIQRNLVSNETGLPDSFEVGDKAAPSKNIKWTVAFDQTVYGAPVIANGKVFISASVKVGDEKYPMENVRAGRRGALYCLDEKTGNMLWRFIGGMSPDYPEGFTYGGHGLITAPVVENDRLYLFGGRLLVFCLTTNGLSGTNTGPFLDEAKAYDIKPPFTLDATDADIVWMFDAKKSFSKIVYHDAYSFGPLVYGDYIYASTGNSTVNDKDYENPDKKPRANADVPCFMALNKKTGSLVAVDDEKMGRCMIHGQWGTPCVGVVNDKAQILFGGGNGVVYAFNPVSGPVSDGKVGVLNCIWSFDPNAHLGSSRRFEIYGAPVCVNNRVYAALSQDWTHPKTGGILVCIDATKSGDITQTGMLWNYKDISLSDGGVAVSRGLLYATDLNGWLHCLDAETGKLYWKFDAKSAFRAGAVVADGKVYVGTEKGEFFIFKEGKTEELLFRTNLRGEISTPCSIANGCLYLVVGKKLFAIQK